MAQKSIDQQVKEAVKKFDLLPKKFAKRERKKFLRKAAKPLIKAARNNIPESDEPHYRYATAKASSSKRAPKGEGNIVAVYYPGNLKKSIRALSFRKSGSIFVGPKLQKRGAFGEFGKGNKVDGYYAAMMEFGTRNFGGVHYMRKGLATSKSQVERIIISESTKVIKDFIKKNKI